MVSTLRTRAPPAQISITLPLEVKPRLGGAEAPAASGGEGASIAQMYIGALAGGYPLSPMPPAGGRSVAAGRRKERDAIMTDEKHHLHIELTPAQYRLLTDQAKQCGLTKRAYLVRLIEGTPVKARPSQEIKDLRTEIHHIGNNINQIARSVNAGIARAEDARRGLYLLDQVYELMYQIAKK